MSIPEANSAYLAAGPILGGFAVLPEALGKSGALWVRRFSPYLKYS